MRLNRSGSVTRDIIRLASQLGLDTDLLLREIAWALGEARIDTLMPELEDYRHWVRADDGLYRFWRFANRKLGAELSQEEIQDIWECIGLTLTRRVRKRLTLDDYLMVVMRSDQECSICKGRPPECSLEIDHILPVTHGGNDAPLNLRFLCKKCNCRRGNRFRWADVWRYMG